MYKRQCPHHAKKAITDPISILENFQYTIALPPPSLYGQYNNLEEQDLLLEALLGMGFDSVFEVAKAAELVSDATRRLLQTGSMKRPVISSACPAVTRLIRVRFPELIDHVLPLVAPIELAARMAKKDAVRKTGLPKEAIGCIFLTPCPAKVTATRSPVGSAHSEVDGAVAIKDIYPRLLASMKRIQQVDYLASAGRIGLGWAESGGEAAGLVSTDSYLAADGIENVIRVLEVSRARCCGIQTSPISPCWNWAAHAASALRGTAAWKRFCTSCRAWTAAAAARPPARHWPKT